MLPYFVLGVGLVAGLLLAGRWYSIADPKTLVRVFKWLLIGIIGVVALFFLVTGKLAWALFAIPALLPWYFRARSAARMAKSFARMAGGGGSPGEKSDVVTDFLKMSLNHDNGAMTGVVLKGTYAGRRVEEMTKEELMSLLKVCWVEDQQSAQVLEAYLGRVHPDWRQQASGARADGVGGDGPMNWAEALEVLGLEEGVSKAEIKVAHKRLIAGLHPDHGGSTYLAAKINQAKDILLGG